MTQFAIYATLMIVAVIALMLPSLWFPRRAPKDQAERKAANLIVYRDQLADLEREVREGLLAEKDFDQARTELQRRLLEDVEVADADKVSDQTKTSRPTALALILLLPVASLAAYAMLGTPKAIDPMNTAPQKAMTAQDIEGMVAKLAARLQENPDDLNGWVMLGRSYKMMGRYAEAVAAYEKGESLIEKDPELLASYAETLAMASGQGLTGKAKTLIEQALKLDPKHGHSLFLAGAAAIESGDGKAAITYWESLLPQVEPGSELDQMLRNGIEQIKAEMAKAK